MAISLVLAGSCAPVSQGSFAGSNAPYDVGEAEKTLVFGYSSIVERHLERVTVAIIALEGMRGLGSIDPEVGISRLGDRVLLSASDRVVAEYPAPSEDDTRAWARLTVTVALEARGVSKAVRDADGEKVYEAVFDAVLGKLDMFSRYAGAKEAREHRASRNGFGGIGIKFDMVDSEAKIVEVMEDTPAAAAGVKLGDVITHVEGQPVKGMERADLSAKLRGPVSSDLKLALRREAAAMQVSLRRALIVPPTVTLAINGSVAEFKVTSFNQRTAGSMAAQLKEARAKRPDIKGVVLDLRGNPGGLLDQAVSMSDLFMADGPVVSTKGRHPSASQSFDARPGDAGEDLPVVVLVDGKSASAAEIVASALQDAGRAVVVGTNSYGKGTVQTVLRLPNDGEMTLTWSRFHTPSGYALHGLGVLPTICTSDEKATSGGLMNGLVHANLPAPVTGNLVRWRHAGLEETGLRKELRGTCPPSKHGDARIDLELAETLLGDRDLFRRALSMSAPATTAAQPSQSRQAATLQQVGN